LEGFPEPNQSYQSECLAIIGALMRSAIIIATFNFLYFDRFVILLDATVERFSTVLSDGFLSVGWKTVEL
jgi:hypothetical protein